MRVPLGWGPDQTIADIGWFLAYSVLTAGRLLVSDLFWLSDEAWSAIESHLPKNQPGAPRVDDRRIISGILYVLKVGCRWRDVPAEYGPAKTVYSRYHRARRRIWHRIFEKMAAKGPVPHELSIDSTHIKAHRSAQGSEGGLGTSNWYVSRWTNKQNPLLGR